MAQAILRLPAVKSRTGLSRSTIYLRVSQGTFPKPIKLGAGARAIGFLESEVERWIKETIKRNRDTLTGAGKKGERKATSVTTAPLR